MNFRDKLHRAAQRNKSLLCLGLDPDPRFMPQVNILEFNKAIIDATSDIVCTYKPNLAFYEAMGIEGFTALQETVKYIPGDIPVIGDAKRGDIGNTSRAYATALFDYLDLDAVTVNPYLGYDSIEPFINYADKEVFVLCRTSNPGAADFQNLSCLKKGAGNELQPLFKTVAERATEWNKQGNIGLVVGATYPRELAEIRLLCPEMLFLIPGIGAQGGDLAQAVRYGAGEGGDKAIFNSSRQILYASKGFDFAQAARQAADNLRQQINSMLPDPTANRK